MYIPALFKNEDLSAVKDFIAANGFATLVSHVNGRPWATHIPLMLDTNAEGKEVLTGHISKANNQWKAFNDHDELLVIFTGPHAYVSSSWYDHENAPTWNYTAVHVYGRISMIAGDLLKSRLGKLLNKYEAGMKHPVSIETMSPGFVEKEMRGIVGFDIEITEIQAASKLSQNRDAKNYDAIINELLAKGDKDSLAMAGLMKEEQLKNKHR